MIGAWRLHPASRMVRPMVRVIVLLCSTMVWGSWRPGTAARRSGAGIDDHGVDSTGSRVGIQHAAPPEAVRTTRGSITQPNTWRLAMVRSRLWPLAEGVTKSNAVEQLTTEEQSRRSHCRAIIEPFIEV